jgi:hypothetical protein
MVTSNMMKVQLRYLIAQRRYIQLIRLIVRLEEAT